MEPFRSSRPLASPRGFTLVEMLVVLGIIVVVTAAALLGQNQFNNSLVLTDTAYTVAFSIREAQSLGLSSQAYSGVQNAGYGVYFSRNAPLSLRAYYLFADISNTCPVPNTCPAPNTCPTGAAGTPEYKPGNCRYNSTGSPADSVVQRFDFSPRFSILRFCGDRISDNVEICSDSSSNAIYTLHVVFVRPNTDTIITGIRSDNTTLVPLKNAEIYVQASDGTSRGVCLSQVGQVFVASSTCPF